GLVRVLPNRAASLRDVSLAALDRSPRRQNPPQPPLLAASAATHVGRRKSDRRLLPKLDACAGRSARVPTRSMGARKPQEHIQCPVSSRAAKRVRLHGAAGRATLPTTRSVPAKRAEKAANTRAVAVPNRAATIREN